MYASIYTHDTVYCPPQEEGCALLEVSLGCSWGKCTFCDFAKDDFMLIPLSLLESRVKVLSKLEPDKTRMFLLGVNAFVMSAERLRAIIRTVKTYMPKITEFAMYARIDDITAKSDEELAMLRKYGICDLHIGIESGSDSILSMMNKGITTFDMVQALRRLSKASIGYYVTIIMGLGGKTYRNLHAIETARFLNRLHPKHIWALSLKRWPGTKLEELINRGEFIPETPREMLLEERLFLTELTLKDSFFMDTTVLNKYTIQGFLPGGKDAMIQAINALLLDENEFMN